LIDCVSVHSLISCIPAQCSSQEADVFLATVIHTVHIIWLSRNTTRFSSDSASINSAKIRIHTLIAMSPLENVHLLIQLFWTLLRSPLIAITWRKSFWYCGRLPPILGWKSILMALLLQVKRPVGDSFGTP